MIALVVGSGIPIAGQPAPLGKLVDMGGYRLRLYCTGQGSPTVVLSPGGGDFSFDWYLVQQKISSFGRVCSYDRAGYAWSEPGQQPLTLHQEAYELREVLRRAKEHGPYVLVGQSLGGLVVRVFADRYPQDAAGIVLVDATSPDTTLIMRGKLVHMRELAQVRPIPDVQTMESSRAGLPGADELKQSVEIQKQVGERKIEPPFDQLPDEIQKLQLWASSLSPRLAQDDYLAEEMKLLYDQGRANAHPLGSRPLITIVAMRPSPPPRNLSPELWQELFNEKVDQKRGYAALSTNSKVMEAPKASPQIQLDEPDTVVAACREVIRAIQQHARLVP